ncbi:unnamed protein product [Arabis nemorensis]|uniref:Uncharacterized protein n=1 Tax=Arabis nemorensis TaxID=586526 RepID=A0A565B057_9BRAS|nr:unnamed protein product [Arabis nemorensis]
MAPGRCRILGKPSVISPSEILRCGSRLRHSSHQDGDSICPDLVTVPHHLGCLALGFTVGKKCSVKVSRIGLCSDCLVSLVSTFDGEFLVIVRVSRSVIVSLCSQLLLGRLLRQFIRLF